jgi:hypothetical protein
MVLLNDTSANSTKVTANSNLTTPLSSSLSVAPKITSSTPLTSTLSNTTKAAASNTLSSTTKATTATTNGILSTGILYNGTSTKDTFTANSTGVDKIYGFGGDDILTLNGVKNFAWSAYNSIVSGGDGNDIITVNNSTGVTIFGDAGNNTINASNSSRLYIQAGLGKGIVNLQDVDNSFVSTGSLNDVVTSAGNSLDYHSVYDVNSITAGSGDDAIAITTQGNYVIGDLGNDTITASFSITKALPKVGSTVTLSVNDIDGRAGNDVITSYLPVGVYKGGAGDDSITIDNSNAIYKNYTFKASQIDASTNSTINTWNTVVDGGSGKDTIVLNNVNKALVADGSISWQSSQPGVSYLDHAADVISVKGNDNTILLTDGDVLTATGVNNDVRLYFAENQGAAGSITSTNAASANLNYKGANELYLMGNTVRNVTNDYKNYVVLRQGNDLLIGAKTTNLFDTVIKGQFTNFSGFESIKANVNVVGNYYGYKFLPTDWKATLGVTDLVTLTNNLANSHFTSLDAVRASTLATSLIERAWHIV